MAETRLARTEASVIRDDWTKKLAKVSEAAGTTVTISGTPTVTATAGATVSSVTVSGNSVLFRLNVTGVTAPVEVVTTTTANLSNGDTGVQSVHKVLVA